MKVAGDEVAMEAAHLAGLGEEGVRAAPVASIPKLLWGNASLWCWTIRDAYGVGRASPEWPGSLEAVRRLGAWHSELAQLELGVEVMEWELGKMTAREAKPTLAVLLIGDGRSFRKVLQHG